MDYTSFLVTMIHCCGKEYPLSLRIRAQFNFSNIDCYQKLDKIKEKLKNSNLVTINATMLYIKWNKRNK